MVDKTSEELTEFSPVDPIGGGTIFVIIGATVPGRLTVGAGQGIYETYSRTTVVTNY